MPTLLRRLDRAASTWALGELGDRRAARAGEGGCRQGKELRQGPLGPSQAGRGRPDGAMPARYSPTVRLTSGTRLCAARLLAASHRPRDPGACPNHPEGARLPLDARLHQCLGPDQRAGRRRGAIGCFDVDFSKKTKQQLGMYHTAAVRLPGKDRRRAAKSRARTSVPTRPIGRNGGTKRERKRWRAAIALARLRSHRAPRAAWSPWERPGWLLRGPPGPSAI